MTCGIYLIKNKKTGQKYIGQSIDIERRWSEHKRYGQYRNDSYIDRAINKYGENNFELIIIEETPIYLLNEREEYWISFYNTFEDKKHYNLTPGGEFAPSRVPEIAKKILEKRDLSGKKNPFYGKKHSIESRKKMSESHKGKKIPQEVCDKISKTNTGRKHSQETKAKISEKVSGKNHPMYNKHHSGASKQQISYTLSIKKNTTGYYRVTKKKCKNCKQGFTWRYNYYDNGKHKSIESVNIKKLEEKVKAQGLKWEEIK